MTEDSESLLAQRAILQSWMARVGSVVASQMLMVAIAWQMYDSTGSA